MSALRMSPMSYGPIPRSKNSGEALTSPPIAVTGSRWPMALITGPLSMSTAMREPTGRWVEAHVATASVAGVTERAWAPTRYGPGTYDQSGPEPNIMLPRKQTVATPTVPTFSHGRRCPDSRRESHPPTRTATPKKMNVVDLAPTCELEDDTLVASANG